MGMETSPERMAINEDLFRQVNERIRELAYVHPERERYEFMCECSDLTCTQRIRLTLDEYDRTRKSPTRFVLAPDHVAPEVEHVVEESDDHVFVEKDGGAARTAIDLAG